MGKMKIITRALAVLVFFGWAGGASAIPIGGSDIVTVDDIEWAQVDLFGGLSWNDITNVCPAGICTDGGKLNGYDMSGWTWASLDDIGEMLGLFTGHDHVNDGFNLTERNSFWAPSILDAFRPTSVDPNRGMVITISRFTAYNPFNGMVTPASVAITDWYPGGCCITDNINLWPVESLDWSQSNYGSWFYRAEVPLPGTLMLLGLGVVALSFSRRNRYS